MLTWSTWWTHRRPAKKLQASIAWGKIILRGILLVNLIFLWASTPKTGKVQDIRSWHTKWSLWSHRTIGCKKWQIVQVIPYFFYFGPGRGDTDGVMCEMQFGQLVKCQNQFGQGVPPMWAMFFHLWIYHWKSRHMCAKLQSPEWCRLGIRYTITVRVPKAFGVQILDQL